jgi:hypothetical protein
LTFHLQRYAECVRDACPESGEPWPDLTDQPRLLAIGPTGFLNDIAHLLACGLLDARFDCLLIPIRLRNPQGDVAESLEAQNWGVPAGFWRNRLNDGACILLIDAAPQDAPWIEASARKWPRCRFLVAAETEIALDGWAVTSRRTSSAPSA